MMGVSPACGEFALFPRFAIAMVDLRWIGKEMGVEPRFWCVAKERVVLC